MRVLDQFAREKSGAAAVEFAFVSMILVMTLVFMMIVALITYFNQALDYATQKASRRIMTGQVQDNAISQSAFRTQVLCSYLPAAMNCSNVIINIHQSWIAVETIIMIRRPKRSTMGAATPEATR